MPTTLELRSLRVELRVGRKLTAAEEHIDVEAIDTLLNQAKDQLEQAIRDEQRRAARAVARGGNARLEVTDSMLRILRRLREQGRRHARAELESMGYPVTDRRRLASDDEIEGTLRARLGSLTAKIERQALGGDLSTVATAAIQKSVLDVLGARGIAADLVSPTFVSGLADTFEQHLDAVEAWQYTAINDAGLCDQCAPYDGVIFDTLDDLFEVLPDFGPNPACLGGTRCRCRAVPVPPDPDAPRQSNQPPSDGADFSRSTVPAMVAARDTVGALGRLHDIPADAPAVRVRVGRDLPDEVAGEYTRVRGGGPLIKMNPAADAPGFTFLHEYGHYLDDAVTGDSVEFASQASAELEEWRDALGRSDAVQTLLQMAYGYVDTLTVTVNGADWLVPVDVDYVWNYLLHPSELFARSYSQWAATRLGHADLRAELARQQRRPYPEQWSDDDFAPIAEAFDRLIERLGWKTGSS